MELRHSILGLLSMQPMSGYDLGRAFAGSVAHFWHADQSQIYRTLDRLTAEGAIDTEVIPQEGRPDRKVHTLTAVGEATLDQWLASPIETVKPKIPLLARLFFAARLGRDGVRRLLDEHERHVRDELARLLAIDPRADDGAPGALRAATLRYGVAAAEAELAWLLETRERVDAVDEWP